MGFFDLFKKKKEEHRENIGWIDAKFEEIIRNLKIGTHLYALKDARGFTKGNLYKLHSILSTDKGHIIHTDMYVESDDGIMVWITKNGKVRIPGNPVIQGIFGNKTLESRIKKLKENDYLVALKGKEGFTVGQCYCLMFKHLYTRSVLTILDDNYNAHSIDEHVSEESINKLIIDGVLYFPDEEYEGKQIKRIISHLEYLKVGDKLRAKKMYVQTINGKVEKGYFIKDKEYEVKTTKYGELYIEGEEDEEYLVGEGKRERYFIKDVCGNYNLGVCTLIRCEILEIVEEKPLYHEDVQKKLNKLKDGDYLIGLSNKLDFSKRRKYYISNTRDNKNTMIVNDLGEEILLTSPEPFTTLTAAYYVIHRALGFPDEKQCEDGC